MADSRGDPYQLSKLVGKIPCNTKSDKVITIKDNADCVTYIIETRGKIKTNNYDISDKFIAILMAVSHLVDWKCYSKSESEDTQIATLQYLAGGSPAAYQSFKLPRSGSKSCPALSSYEFSVAADILSSCSKLAAK